VREVKPEVVVACDGRPRWTLLGTDPYQGSETQYLATWPEGAITITSGQRGLFVRTFQTGRELTLPSAPGVPPTSAHARAEQESRGERR
jgi:hypothetical protein